MQVEYKTEKGTIYFQKVNDAQTKFDVNNGYLRGFDKYGVYETIKLPSDDWQLIGLTTEITEENAKMVMKFTGSAWNTYKDYTCHNNWFSSALWSFKSLMQHLNIYDVNPLGEFPTLPNFKRLLIGVVERKQQRWKEAQSRTGKWIVLFKPD